MENRLSFSRGCLLGMAIGDAMGSTVDKKSWEDISLAYGPNGLLGYDLQDDYAEVSSYTQLAAFTANGLLLGATRAHADAYPKYIALSQREWAKSQQFRLSPEKTYCWVAQVPSLRRRNCMDTHMLESLNRDTTGTCAAPVNAAFSPGALTCAVAVGLFFDPIRMDVSQLGILGAEAVAVSHGAPEAFLSGAVIAYAVAGILYSPEHTLAEQFTQAASAVQNQLGKQHPQAMQKISAFLEKALTLTKDPELTPLAAMTILGCTSAAECLAGALYASIMHEKNFDEGMITSVNHSGRSAAVGALTGAFLGARLGAEALPEFYLESLQQTSLLTELAEDLALGRQTTRIFDDDWDQKYVQGLPVHR